MSIFKPTLGFVGGTGKEGRGLALRFAAAGHAVLIGSRTVERAVAAADKLRARLEQARRTPSRLEGLGNEAAVANADVVFLTLPYAGLDAFLAERGAALADKIVVDVVNPIVLADDRFVLVPVDGGSASGRIARMASGARVVSGFKNVAASHLLALDAPVEGDILLASDDPDAKSTISDLTREIPNLRPVDAGPLANAAFLEALTALQLNVNRLHRTLTAIRILGV